MKVISQPLIFLLNIFIAALGTGIIQSPLTQFFRQSAKAVVLREDFLSVTVAFGLGCLVYHKWQSATARWVWIAGLCWFVAGTLRLWLGQSALRMVTGTHGTVFWEMSGVGCMSELNACWKWMEFTLPLLRTISFSLGALCYPQIERFVGKIEQRLA